MLDGNLFPVCCTADVSPSTIDKLLRETLAESERLAPGSVPSLVVATTIGNGRISIPTNASQPPTEAFTSPFIGLSIEEVSQQISDVDLFATLDERSKEDGTATLVSQGPEGHISTVRAAFELVQIQLMALRVGSLGFEELQSIATSSGGVLKNSSGSVKKGGPAPRKQLGK